MTERTSCPATGQRPPNAIEVILGRIAVDALQGRFNFLRQWAMDEKIEMYNGVPIVRLSRAPDPSGGPHIDPCERCADPKECGDKKLCAYTLPSAVAASTCPGMDKCLRPECASRCAIHGEQYIKDVSILLADALNEPCKGCGKRPIDFVSGEVAPSETERSEDAQDAARYRWLRTYWRRVVSHADSERIVWMSLHSDNTIATNEDSVDAAIDKAMEEARYVRR